MDRLLELTHRAEISHFWFRGFRRFVGPVIADAAGARSNLTLLDCGCGTGHNLKMLAPYGRTFGFDLTASGLEVARQVGRPLARADVTRIPFRSNSFDVVTCFDVLQCVPEDVRAVGEMARVLKPGGTLILTLAAFEALRGDHAEFSGEVRRYTRRSARQLAAAAALDVERATYLFASLFPLVAGTRVLQRVLRPVRRPTGEFDITVPAAPVNAALTLLVMGEAAMVRRLAMPVGSSVLLVARKRGG